MLLDVAKYLTEHNANFKIPINQYIFHIESLHLFVLINFHFMQSIVTLLKLAQLYYLMSKTVFLVICSSKEVARFKLLKVRIDTQIGHRKKQTKRYSKSTGAALDLSYSNVFQNIMAINQNLTKL